MIAALDDTIAVHALDALDPADAAALDAALADDPALRRDLDAYREIAAQLGLVLGAAPPPASARARLLEALDDLVRPGRLDAFAARVAALFDVTIDKARMFLGWIDDPARWEPAPVPGVELVHLPGGPACRAADCGFVRVAPGAPFPLHLHDGEEVTLVLEGAARYSDGRLLAPGDELVVDAASRHDFIASGLRPYLFAVRHHGVHPVLPA